PSSSSIFLTFSKLCFLAYSKTNFKMYLNLSPNVVGMSPLAYKEKLNTSFGYGLDLEIPLLPFLASGVQMDFYSLFEGENSFEVTGDQLGKLLQVYKSDPLGILRYR
ncbi:MAG: hypothetical protein ACFFKA_09825, partial [Candidatus Thorarchaeota archaeon]